jgi:hypothetical protein
MKQLGARNRHSFRNADFILQGGNSSPSSARSRRATRSRNRTPAANGVAVAIPWIEANVRDKPSANRTGVNQMKVLAQMTAGTHEQSFSFKTWMRACEPSSPSTAQTLGPALRGTRMYPSTPLTEPFLSNSIGGRAVCRRKPDSALDQVALHGLRRPIEDLPASKRSAQRDVLGVRPHERHRRPGRRPVGSDQAAINSAAISVAMVKGE